MALTEQRKRELDLLLLQDQNTSSSNFSTISPERKLQLDTILEQTPRSEVVPQVESLGAKLSERGRDILSAIEEARQDPLNLLIRTPLRTVGAVAGGVIDVGGRILSGLAEDYAEAFLTEESKQQTADTLQKLFEGSPLAEAQESFEKWEPDHPELGQDIRDVANILGLVVAGPKIPKPYKAPAIDLSTVIDVEAIGMKVGVVDPALGKSLNEVITKGIKPKMKGTAGQQRTYNTKAKQAFIVINNTKTSFLGDSGFSEIRNPTNRAEVLDAIGQSKTRIFEEYNTLAEESGGLGGRINTNAIDQELARISESLGKSREIRYYANQLRTDIQELGNATPLEIQERIADLNNSLGAFYDGRVSKGKAQVDASVAAMLRTELDNLINSLTGANYQALKNRYGALSTIETDVARQVAVEARKANKGLLDFTDVFTGADILLGLVSANPAAVVKGLTGRAIKEYYKYLNDPNRYIENVFKALENSSIKNKPRAKRPEPAGLLGEGAIPAKGAEIVQPTQAEILQRPEFQDRPGKFLELPPGNVDQIGGPTRIIPLPAPPTFEAPAKIIGKTDTKVSDPRLKEALDRIEDEIQKRIEDFRKESGMMASNEGTGVRTRAVEDARGNTEWMASGFNLNRAKGDMKRRAGDLKKEAHSLLYENDPEFRALVDSKDSILEAAIPELKDPLDADEIDRLFSIDETRINKDYPSTYVKKESPPSSPKTTETPTKATPASASKEAGANQALIQEARKYKSAEEFVEKIQGSATQYGEYNPQFRIGGIEGYENITKLGVDPDEMVTIYRGIDDTTGKVPREINDGDFVTTDFDSARAYATSPEDVVSMEIKAKDLYVDEPEGFAEDPFFIGAEYIYTTKGGDPLTKSQLTDIWNQANKKTGD